MNTNSDYSVPGVNSFHYRETAFCEERSLCISPNTLGIVKIRVKIFFSSQVDPCSYASNIIDSFLRLRSCEDEGPASGLELVMMVPVRVFNHKPGPRMCAHLIRTPPENTSEHCTQRLLQILSEGNKRSSGKSSIFPASETIWKNIMSIIYIYKKTGRHKTRARAGLSESYQKVYHLTCPIKSSLTFRKVKHEANVVH